MQDNFYYLLSLVVVILFFVILYIAHAFYHALQQIKSTARTIEETIKNNQEIFDNLKVLTERLNNQIGDLSPLVKQLNEVAQKIKDMRAGMFNLLLLVSNLAGGYFGKIPMFIAGVRWMLKKFKKGGKNV